MWKIRIKIFRFSHVAPFFGMLLAGALLAGCAGTNAGDAFSEADHAIRIAARADALENRKSGEAANWHNPDSGNRGTVVPTRTYKSDFGEDCREFQETVTAGDRTAVYNGTSCRKADGTWHVARGPYRRDSAAHYDPWGPHWSYGVRHRHFGYWGPPRFGYGAYYGGW